jgi:transposase
MEIDSGSEEQHLLRTYRATLVPPEVRVFVAKVAPALKEQGVSYKRQREIYSEAGYEISRPSFSRYLASMHDSEAPLSTDKHVGRPRALTEREIMIFVGWLLTQNDENEPVGIRECVSFIEDHLGHELSTGTVHKYLMASGFSSHVGRRRTAGYRLNFEILVDLYMADVRRFWEFGIKHMPPGRVACIDSSSIGWRLLTRKTYSPKGGKQPKIKKGNPAYTNLVVWAVSLTVLTDALRFYLLVIRSLLSDRARKTSLTICLKNMISIRAESYSVQTKSMWASLRRPFRPF